MTEWTEIKAEDTQLTFAPTPASAVESAPYSTPPESKCDSDQNVSVPEPEHTSSPTRTHVSTPSDRQRTAQACDKCRERKTKVGDGFIKKAALKS